MKRLIAILMMVVITIPITACGNKDTMVQMEPNLSQMKAICEFGVMECYYHNVAKFKDTDVEGFLWWKKDKHFWIEYSGVVRLGIDTSQMTMEVSGTTITITLPEAKVLSCKVDSEKLTKDSFIVADKSAKITAEDETVALTNAQAHMQETAESNSSLLANARQRAQLLLEGYINNIGAMLGVQYTIHWIYVDNTGAQTGTATTTTEPTA